MKIYSLKLHIFFICILLISVSLKAQTTSFHKFYLQNVNAFQTVSCGETLDHGYMMAARTDSGTFLLKTNAQGDEVWEKRFEDAFEIFGMLQSPDSGLVLTTATYDSSLTIQKIIKTNSLGDAQWSFQDTCACYPMQLIKMADGDYLAVENHILSDSNLNSTTRLIELNPSGSVVWEKNLVMENRVHLASVISTNDDGFLLGSNVSGSNGNIDYDQIQKLNSVGDTTWTKKYYPTDPNFLGTYGIRGLLQKNDSSIIWLTPSGNGCDLIKLNAADGGFISRTSYNPFQLSEVFCSHFAKTLDDGIVVTGEIGSANTPSAMMCFKIDHNDNVQWSFIDNSDDRIATSVHCTSDSGFIISGDHGGYYGGGPCSDPFWTPQSAFLYKTMSNGALTGISGPTNIEDNSTVFPNPTSGIIQVEIKNHDFSANTIKVVDLLGHIMEQLTINNRENYSVQFDLSHFLPGIYEVVIDGDNFYKTYAVVKQ